MRTFVFTLGFHEDHVIRRLHAHNALREDHIVVFTVRPVATAVKRAFDGLKGFTSRAGLRDPELIELPLNTPDAIYTIINTLRDRPRPFIVDLSGGMRVLAVYVMTALLLMKEDADIYLQPETGTITETVIPKELFEFMRSPLTPTEIEVLKEISNNPGITISELAKATSKSEKTIRNMLARLRKLLVVQKGRRAGLYPTKWVKTLTPIKPKEEEESFLH